RRVAGLHLAGAYSDGSLTRTPLYSFSIDGVHPEDAAQILDKMGIAVRSGLMCAEPIVKKYSEKGLIRVSLLPYNTEEEIDIFADALAKTIKMLS
ncbi:MAG: aminotransferase class V-fold PLP-dependent enzyme, partial [Bacteroidales bacterium]|nr:aminotransferase class V-fold PLP-dependent enzyme [Bacteroidales bacterium]